MNMEQAEMKTGNTTTASSRWPIRAFLLACLLGTGNAIADSGKLLVELENVRDDSGQIRASIYSDPESFRKEDKALKIVSLPARAGNITLNLDGLAPGRYAVMVYHDANNDQKLNLRFGMFPTEGYGLSNNPVVMGPPKFSESVFDLKAGENRISIKIAY